MLEKEPADVNISDQMGLEKASDPTDIPAKEPIADINGPIFERMIILVPYRSSTIVKHVEEIFEKINLAGLNLENSRYLATKELTEEETTKLKLIKNHGENYVCFCGFLSPDIRLVFSHFDKERLN